MLFTLYTSPLGDIFRKHKVNFHSYTDDQQNYLSFRPTDKTAKTESMERLHRCITDIRCWMHTNLLKLNDSKTEFVVMGMRQQLSLVGELSIKIEDDTIDAVTFVQNLGFFMDSEMKNGTHINKLTSSLCVILKNIARIRPLLNKETTKILVQP